MYRLIYLIFSSALIFKDMHLLEEYKFVFRNVFGCDIIYKPGTHYFNLPRNLIIDENM